MLSTASPSPAACSTACFNRRTVKPFRCSCRCWRGSASRRRGAADTPLHIWFVLNGLRHGDHGQTAATPARLGMPIRCCDWLCRHRGAKVASGSGSGKRLFVCPYHAWTYDLEGRLTRVAPAEGFPGIACADRSLVPLPVAEKYGLIFVQATPGEGIDVDALLGELGAELASYGFDGYTHYETQTLAKDFKGPADFCVVPQPNGLLVVVPDLVQGELRFVQLGR